MLAQRLEGRQLGLTAWADLAGLSWRGVWVLEALRCSMCIQLVWPNPGGRFSCGDVQRGALLSSLRDPKQQPQPGESCTSAVRGGQTPPERPGTQESFPLWEMSAILKRFYISILLEGLPLIKMEGRVGVALKRSRDLFCNVIRCLLCPQPGCGSRSGQGKNPLQI